jgi:hypothetical protein
VAASACTHDSTNGAAKSGAALQGASDEAGDQGRATAVKKGRSSNKRLNGTDRPVQTGGARQHAGRKARTNPLLQTRLAGDRKREEWLAEIAEQSSREAWNRDKAENEVRKAAIKAIFADHITTESSFANLVAEGTLATDPAVRDHVPRLIALRDAIWGNDPDFLRDVLHGPSQTLVDLMRRHKRASERHHTASVEAYLTYLRRRFAA